MYIVYTRYMNTVINIRIDKKTKEKAQRTFSDLGLDMTSGIKMFLNQVVTEGGIPFVSNSKSAKIRAKWDKEVAEAIKSGKYYNSAREMHEDILGKKAYVSSRTK